METVNVTEAKAKFSAIVDKVCAGEEVLVTRYGQPAVKIVRVKVKHADTEPKKFRIGLFEGTMNIPDDWDTWPEEEARALGIID